MESLQPKLRFPGFEDDWEKIKLDNFTKSISSGKSKAREDEGEFLLYGSTGFIGYTNENDYKGKCILIARVGANAGNLYKVEGKYSVTDNTLMLYTNENNYFDFTYYLLIKAELNKLVFGSGQPLITGGQLKNLNLFVPKLEEQTRIANFLSSVDEKLDLLKEKKALLEDYKKGMMQKIFNQEIRFKDNNGEDFEEWEEKSLGEVLIKNSKKNKLLEITYVESISNKQGFVSQEEYFDSNNIASKNLCNYYVIENGMFAYNPSRIDVGSLAYKNDDKSSVISPLYISFKTNNLIDDVFLFNYFDTLYFKNQMNSSFEGSVRNTLSYDSLIKIKIQLPSLKEQTKIANFLSAIDEKIELVLTQIEDTQEYKKGLLQQMFV